MELCVIDGINSFITLLGNMYTDNNMDPLVFYKMMDYKVPKNEELFYWLTKQEEVDISKYAQIPFSWTEKSPIMDEFMNFINKYGWVYRSLPFVKNIYLCNSIAFNNIHDNSDIDLFFVCESNRLWTARFFSVLMFQVLGIRRYKTKIKKRFCLTFYLAYDSLNLYNFILKPLDLYFTYWIAHLVSLYSTDYSTSDLIFKENFWINNYLPNLPLKQNIFLGNKIFIGGSWFKKTVEFILNGFIGDLFEKLLKLVWMPIMFYKKRKLGKKAWGVIISDKILKFYGGDIRKFVNFKYKFFNKVTKMNKHRDR